MNHPNVGIILIICCVFCTGQSCSHTRFSSNLPPRLQSSSKMNSPLQNLSLKFITSNSKGWIPVSWSCVDPLILGKHNLTLLVILPHDFFCCFFKLRIHVIYCCPSSTHIFCQWILTGFETLHLCLKSSWFFFWMEVLFILAKWTGLYLYFWNTPKEEKLTTWHPCQISWWNGRMGASILAHKMMVEA